jgi:hypothetical protein
LHHSISDNAGGEHRRHQKNKKTSHYLFGDCRNRNKKVINFGVLQLADDKKINLSLYRFDWFFSHFTAH